MTLVARLKAVAVGVVFAASLVALAGAGVLFAARPQAPPPSPKKDGDGPIGASRRRPTRAVDPGHRGGRARPAGQGARVSSLWTFGAEAGDHRRPTGPSSCRPTSRGWSIDRSWRRPTAVRGRGSSGSTRPSGYRGPRTAGAGRAPAGPGGDGHRRRRPGSSGRGCGRRRPRPGLPGGRGPDGRPRHRRAPRPGRREDAVDRRLQAGRRLRLLRELSRAAGDALVAAPAARPARPRRRAHRPRPRGRLGRSPRAGRRDVPVDDPEEGQAQSGPPLAAYRIKARTDADGVATFDWLPADLHGRTSFYPVSTAHSVLQWHSLDPGEPGWS